MRRALDDLAPDLVLVEAPIDAQQALSWIGHEGLIPPVALLGYVVTEPERAVFAPLASFSPEWQAASWAAGRGVELRAIDLPLAVTLADRSLARAGSPIDPLAELAAAGGDADPERWWDDLVEHRGDGEPVFDAVADAMGAVRTGVPTGGDDVRREAHMRQQIRRALEGGAVVAVVCGAWHVPALDPDVAMQRDDAAVLRGQARAKVAVTWVPWTHRRLRRVSGYGAGVVSPGWYDHVFRHPGPEGVSRFFVDAARTLRAKGMPASPDHLIAASRVATALATLRDRPRPGLAEVLDAADCVLGGLEVVRDELVIGDAIGEVPSEAPQVPLARDLAASQRAARLKPEPVLRTIELDVRTPNGRRRSHLLHRLVALDIPWGVVEEGRGSSGTFRETWRVTWDPELSVRVVEQAGHGTTVAAAATSVLVERTSSADRLPEATEIVQLALLADLPQAVDPAVHRLGQLAADAPDVAELMDAMGPLAMALRYGDARGTEATQLRVVFDELVVRVAAALPRATVALDDDAAQRMVERLSAVQAALAVVDHPARHGIYPAVLEQLADAPRIHGSIQGRATRLLHDGGRWPPDNVERRLARALSQGTAPGSGAAFVEGFLAGSGTVLVHDAQLLTAIDGWIGSLRADAFETVIPLLRRTFGGFEPAERRQLGLLLSTGQVERVAAMGEDVDPARALAALETVRAMLGLPIPVPDEEDGS